MSRPRIIQVDHDRKSLFVFSSQELQIIFALWWQKFSVVQYPKYSGVFPVHRLIFKFSWDAYDHSDYYRIKSYKMEQTYFSFAAPTAFHSSRKLIKTFSHYLFFFYFCQYWNLDLAFTNTMLLVTSQVTQ